MTVIVLIVLFGLLFDYTNGFHDAANVVATPIATKAMKPVYAIAMAALFNFAGGMQVSGVAQTIAKGLVVPEATSQLMIIAALTGAIVWNLITWYFGIPSTSSYALIGGLLGAAFWSEGQPSILWNGVVFKVLIPMIISPFLGFIVSYGLMRCLLLFSQKDRPLYRHFQRGSSAIFAFAHGLNDAQKSMGIITLGLFSAQLIPSIHIPFWVVGSCAAVMALGTAFGGFRIIQTMGFQITELKSIHGFASEVSASAVIVTASLLGIPLSSTNIIVGSITGVGSARGAHHVRWSTTGKMAIAWILTLPGAACISSIVLKLILCL